MKVKAASPNAPFTDFRYEKPGTIRKITVKDLAEAVCDGVGEERRRCGGASGECVAGGAARVQGRALRGGAWRIRDCLRTAPNGDIFLAESDPGRIRVFRGMTSDGKPEQMQIFASGLKQPYGIAFYPPGPDPQWIYIGNTNEVIRFPYHNGDLKASGASQHVADLPAGGGHWTRARRIFSGWQEAVCGRGLGIECG